MNLNELESYNCIICLESEIETSEPLKFIHCECKAKIHKHCLQEYLINNNLSQKCPICNNRFEPTYKLYDPNSFIERILIKIDNCFLRLFILLVMYIIFIFVIFVVIGYLIKISLSAFGNHPLKINPFTKDHLMMGSYGTLVVLISLILCGKFKCCGYDDDDSDDDSEISINQDIEIDNF